MYKILNKFENRDVRITENITVPAGGVTIADIKIDKRITELIKSGAVSIREIRSNGNSLLPTKNNNNTQEQSGEKDDNDNRAPRQRRK